MNENEESEYRWVVGLMYVIGFIIIFGLAPSIHRGGGVTATAGFTIVMLSLMVWIHHMIWESFEKQ